MDGKLVSSCQTKASVPANSSKMLFRLSVGEILKGVSEQDAYVRFIYEDAQKNRYSNLRFFANQKDVRFLRPEMNLEVADKGEYKEVTVVSDVFARAVYLSVEGCGLLHFSDNFFDLHPGEPYKVTVKTDIPATDLQSRLHAVTINSFRHYNM